MKFSDAFPSKYLKADVDVADQDDGGTTLTIKSFEWERVGNGPDAKDELVVYFREVEKGLVLNKTNGNTLASLFNDDTSNAIGRRIRLFAKDVEYQGKMTRGIRIASRLPADGPAPPSRVPGPVAEDAPF